MADLEITGLKEAQQMLTDSASLIAAQLLGKALDHAAGVIQAAVEARCPTTYLAGNRELRESVILVTEINLQAKSGESAIGFSPLKRNDRTGKPMDVIAMWVEYGHVQLTHKGESPKHGDTQVPPHPFMRPAFDDSADRAIEVFASTLLDGIADILPTEET